MPDLGINKNITKQTKFTKFVSLDATFHFIETPP
jgi:hypothetical protein